MSRLGLKVQDDVALQTGKLNPPHIYLPWIMVDGAHIEEKEIMDDIVKWACKNYKGDVKLDECKSHVKR